MNEYWQIVFSSELGVTNFFWVHHLSFHNLVQAIYSCNPKVKFWGCLLLHMSPLHSLKLDRPSSLSSAKGIILAAQSGIIGNVKFFSFIWHVATLIILARKNQFVNVKKGNKKLKFICQISPSPLNHRYPSLEYQFPHWQNEFFFFSKKFYFKFFLKLFTFSILKLYIFKIISIGWNFNSNVSLITNIRIFYCLMLAKDLCSWQIVIKSVHDAFL